VIVVSNTSPIVNLAVIGHLDLLHKLYNRIIIPPAVYNEIVVVGAGKAGAVEVQGGQWFDVRQVANTVSLQKLRQILDAGEAEAVVLAGEIPADLLLIDEHKGRTVAAQSGIKITGLLGLLIVAKQRGYISAVKPVLDDLRTRAKFWIDAQLYARIVTIAGE
jgi:predicted nucleic acid-binding protein